MPQDLSPLPLEELSDDLSRDPQFSIDLSESLRAVGIFKNSTTTNAATTAHTIFSPEVSNCVIFNLKWLVVIVEIVFVSSTFF